MTFPTAAELPALVEVDLGPGVRAGFTTRAHGNLALDVDNDPQQVDARRHALESWAGAPVRFAHHVHGTKVLSPADNPRKSDQPHPVGDAWCTTKAKTPLAVYAADCLPVLFADPKNRVIAAAHAGRVGLFAGMLLRTIDAMVARGAQSIRAIIGPAICAECYEVPRELAASATDLGLPATRTRWHTPSLDLPAIATAQLQGRGADVVNTALCTYDDDRFFSHRRAQGPSSPAECGGAQAGRHAGVVTLS